MNPALQNKKILDVEPGDIVVTKDGTRRCLILKKKYGTATNRRGENSLMPQYTIYSLYFEAFPHLVGLTDHSIPLFKKAWKKVENENN
tara:strand:- start:163 stop:426 length:264 start_codon:yes stop_codon:yes gene_type:complete